ncbi:MAG TPA: MarR family transcriptional regulator [Terriglobales bacterium]|nr:MarR family transcriptional regulator [Terriglobales bacterium]
MTTLSETKKRYILHWGEMGTRWGINRTVAQIHALLYLAPQPLPADEIARTLSVARSNVSTSLRELQSWGLVHPVHILGDRREHYQALKDVWEMFRLIIEQRKRREVDPTRELLRQCLAEAERGDAYFRERLHEMSEFFETMTGLYEEVRQMPPGAVRALGHMRGKLRKLLHFQAG